MKFILFVALFFLVKKESGPYYEIIELKHGDFSSIYFCRNKMSVVLKAIKDKDIGWRGCRYDTLDDLKLSFKTILLSRNQELFAYINKYLSARKSANNWNQSSGFGFCGLNFNFESAGQAYYCIQENACCIPLTKPQQELVQKLKSEFNKINCTYTIEVSPDSEYTDSIIHLKNPGNVLVHRPYRVIAR